MLPVNIIAQWCSTGATLEDIQSVLREYVESSHEQEFPENTFAISWDERTLFTFGDSEWSRNEGSLIFENRRSVLWKENPFGSDQSHLIFIALFPSSLLLLQRDISSLMKDKLDLDFTPTAFGLTDGLAMTPGIVTGAEITNSGKERILFSGTSLFGDYPFKYINAVIDANEEAKDFSVSKLYLRLGEPETDISLSSDGVLTFNDPDQSLDEIVDIISRVVETIPVQGGRRGNQGPLRVIRRELFYGEE